MAYNLYCKNREKKVVKVWTVTFDVDKNMRVMYKNAPHLFGVSGALADLGYKAYATQKECFKKDGRKRVPVDIKQYFEKHPEQTMIVIHDVKEMKKYTSMASDWLLHGVVQDQGDGDQIFLDIKYMKVIDYSNL